MGIDLPLKGAGVPVQQNALAAHYEISRANLTKSLRNFCCTGLMCLILRGKTLAETVNNTL
jgi:hypothetical protein